MTVLDKVRRADLVKQSIHDFPLQPLDLACVEMQIGDGVQWTATQWCHIYILYILFCHVLKIEYLDRPSQLGNLWRIGLP
jgi:hypothetical protein